ncbi:hypothetical protein SLA2020_125000 [Shorea laevis]
MIIRTSSIFAFLVLLMFESAVGAPLGKPGCRELCGNIRIPYPFGIGADCYLSKWFEVSCNETSITPTALLTSIDNIEVLHFSLYSSILLVNRPIIVNYSAAFTVKSVNLSGSPFTSSYRGEKFPLRHQEYFLDMFSWLIPEENASQLPHTYPDAFHCFRPNISSDPDSLLFYNSSLATNGTQFYNSSMAPNGTQFYNSSMAPNGSHQCVCEHGFEGNPYLPHGCKGISLGFGVVGLLIGTYWLYRILKKRRKKKLQTQFFKQNGGFLLQQQLSSTEGNIEKTKIFSTKELERATDHFNKNRILGQGAQGTVYKGMLVDGRIVAVKKSKVLDKEKVKEFINEVVILTQINHRNIVKLLGCCLETEVPLLVYEFISNGTLFQYIHDENEDFPLTWERRLTIAAEVAAALSYLHSAASIPIYHRDVKSSNILLDEKYRAKVSDFGTSRSIAIDQTHLTTNVQGTFGYLDPEYYQTSQFTEKSDVYSFGVVLVELLTGEKPVSLARAEGGRNLASHFIHSMEENNLFSILDARVRESSAREEITKVAKLAHRCLSLCGKKRPKMIEVAVELEQIRLLQNNSNGQQNHEEVTYVKSEVNKLWDGTSTSIDSGLDSGASLSIHMQPLISSKSWGFS